MVGSHMMKVGNYSFKRSCLLLSKGWKIPKPKPDVVLYTGHYGGSTCELLPDPGRSRYRKVTMYVMSGYAVSGGAVAGFVWGARDDNQTLRATWNLRRPSLPYLGLS